jgi:cyclopropane fatty-acyl-phospholipid synthase-like methyltransferase
MHATLKQTLLSRATEPYRPTGHFNFGWARGKLSHDPVFPALIDLALLPDNASVLDIGCGRGLLAAWLLAADAMASEGKWQAREKPPKNLRFRGIELIEREATCGNQALVHLYGDRVHLRAGDMRSATIDSVDVVIILDVLHYVPLTDQDALLDRIRSALPEGGLLILRIGDAASGLRFKISQAVDICMALAQGHRLTRMWCRSLDEWMRALEHRGFAVETHAMSEGTPFANSLLVARLMPS